MSSVTVIIKQVFKLLRLPKTQLMTQTGSYCMD